MNTKFDEFTKGVAQSVTRRGAFKFGVGLAGMALACFGLVRKAEAASNKQCWRRCMKGCVADLMAQGTAEDVATSTCSGICNFKCAF